MDYLKKIFDMKSDQDTSENIHNALANGVKLRGTPLAILFCAIIIASVGLNTNSTAVIIGAMLISPLMNPILAIGYSISTYDGKLFKNALIAFFTLFAIALLTSYIYFSLSPINTATTEILARTQPGIFDFLIAFFGGLAGIIGVSRKEKSNVIPGVAIATALMPPLCTVGYGLATSQTLIAEGAFYLFSINVFFITLSTFIVCKAMKLKQVQHDVTKYDVLIKRSFICISIILFIPLSITSIKISIETYEKEQIISKLQNFVEENQFLNGEKKILSLTYNKTENTLRIDCIGEDLLDSEVEQIKEYMEMAKIGDAELIIVNDLEQIFMEYINQNYSYGVPKVRIVE
ncbi:MAG: DUF389 domain-containing protein [Lachnospirales bacterium]